MTRATFIDFDDSFSFNVIQELTLSGFQVSVVNWVDFETLPSDGLLVLGPGPGHPDDYQSIFSVLKEWLNSKRPFFGVCLGHQIFWRLQDQEVLRSKNPLHGQKIKLKLDQEWRDELKISGDVFVQRYNSLCVSAESALKNPQLKNFIQNDEILMTRGEHLITYQFHPESVGTSFRRKFFDLTWCTLKE